MKKNIFILLSWLFAFSPLISMEEENGKKRKLELPSPPKKKQKNDSLFTDYQSCIINNLIEQEDFETAKEPIENEVDLSHVDKHGNSLLHLIATKKKKSSAFEGKLILFDNDLLTQKKQPKKNLNNSPTKVLGYHTQAQGSARCLFADEELPTEDDFLALSTRHNNNITDHLLIARLLLIKAPFLMLMRNHYGMTPLHCAAHSGNLELVKMFLDAQDVDGNPLVDVDERVEKSAYNQHHESFTPLHFASLKGHAEIVQLLINYGASVDARVEQASIDSRVEQTSIAIPEQTPIIGIYHQSTPLILAAKQRNCETIKILLSNIHFLAPQDFMSPYESTEQNMQTPVSLKQQIFQYLLNNIDNDNYRQIARNISTIKDALKENCNKINDCINYNDPITRDFIGDVFQDASVQFLRERYFAWVQHYCALQDKSKKTAHQLMKEMHNEILQKGLNNAQRFIGFDRADFNATHHRDYTQKKQVIEYLKNLEDGKFSQEFINQAETNIRSLLNI